MFLTRRDPFQNFFAFSPQLNPLFNLASRQEDLAASALPAVDIYEDAEGLTLTAELPGIDPKAVEVKIENQVLTLDGERKAERADHSEGYHRRESWSGRFSRSFGLPSTVDVERVHAEHKNGILRVFLPRREESKPRQIQVKIDA